MRKILIVVDQLHRGGFATHIESEVRSLDAAGIEVHLAVGSVAPGALVPPGLAGLLAGLDLSPQAVPAAVCAAARRLADYARQHKITLIHAHPFTGCVASFLAAGLAQAAFVYTLHGPSSFDAPYGPVYESLLRDYILPGAGCIICVSQETETIARRSGAASVLTLGNPVEPIGRSIERRGDRKRIAFVSRLDQARHHGFAEFLDIAAKLPIESIDLFGDGDARDAFLRLIETSSLADRIHYLGWSYELHARWHHYDCAAGMGRVVLEAGIAGLPVVLVGADGVKGIVTQASFHDAAKCNFSGRNLPNIDGDELARQLVNVEHDPSDTDLRAMISPNYEEGEVWKKMREGLAAIPAVNGRYSEMILRSIEQHAGQRASLYAMSDVLKSLSDVPTPGVRERAELVNAQSELQDLTTRLQKSESAAAVLELTKQALEEVTGQLTSLRAQQEKDQEAFVQANAELASFRAEWAAMKDTRARSEKLTIHMQAELDEALARYDKAAQSLDNERERRIRAEIALGEAEEARLVAYRTRQQLRLTCDELASRLARLREHDGTALSGRAVYTRDLTHSSVTRGLKGLVSIVLPVYNQALYLPQAIQGVLDQTYENWELILVNDGSSDDFAGAITPYLNDSRIRPFTQPNQKLPSALNNGLSRARGEFITWTSADNVMLRTQIGSLVRALVSHPEAGLAYSDYEAIDDRGGPLADREWRSHNRPDGSAHLRLPTTVTVANFHESGDNFLGASFLWRADVQAVVGNHDEHLFGGEDYDFWLRAHMVTPFIHVADPLYLYRVHDNTLNARAKELKIRDNVDRLLECDRQRRAELLRDPFNLVASEYGCWRSTLQLRANVDRSWTHLRYSQFVARGAAADQILVLTIDVPLREIDPVIVGKADIVLTSDDLTYYWLKSQQLPWHIRLFAGTLDTAQVPLLHAVGLRLFERHLETQGKPLAVKPHAVPLVGARPEHVLLMLSSWARGGMEQVVLDLATGLRRNGTRITLAVADDGVATALEDLAERHQLETAGFAGSSDAVVEYVMREQVTVVSYHHCTLAVERLSDTQALTAYTLHNSYIWFNAARRADLQAKLKHMAVVVAVSRQVAAYAQHWFAIDPAKLIVVPNGTDLAGVDADISPALPRIGPEPGRGNFGFLNVATFNRVKLQNILLTAFAKVLKNLPDTRLTLVGSPADSDFYEEILSARTDLGLEDAVSIIPGTDRTTVHTMMRCHDCFVLPSLVEGWSISLLEASVLGMPAIVSDVGSAQDMAHRSAGVHIVRPISEKLEAVDDAALWRMLSSDAKPFERGLVDAMLEAREHHAERAEAALNARDRIALEFSTEAMAEHYRAAFALARAPSRLI